MSRPRALIIGGSLGGLFAAHLLRSIGWDAQIFERTEDDLATRGAGIGTHPELFDLMASIGVSVDPSIGVHLATRICLDRAGNVQLELPLAQTMSAWARIYRPLHAAFPPDRMRFGARLVRAENMGEKVVATFADGSQETGDLLVGADGIRSTVREQWLPDVQPRYAGYVAWRGTVPEREVSAATHATMFHRYTFCLPEGDMLLAYPMPGPDEDVRVGHRIMNFVWYRPTHPDHELRDICTDASGRQHGMAIPPPLIRPDVIARMKQTAHRIMAPQVAEVIERTKQLFFQAIFDLESPRLASGRMVLAGDAAFVARPHVGSGITKAALDAKALANALSAHPRIDVALAQYDRERRQFGQALVARGRMLGAYVEGQLKPPSERTGRELAQDPHTVMHEMGATNAGVREISEAIARTR